MTDHTNIDKDVKQLELLDTAEANGKYIWKMVISYKVKHLPR